MKMLLIKNIMCLIWLLGCQNNTESGIKQAKNETMNVTKRLEVNGMTVEWQYRDDHVFFTIAAPTEGWVTLGFNDKDDIVNTNLIFCRVKSGKVEVADHYVLGAGNHQPTEKLGGLSVFKNVTGKETKDHTTVSFSMPIKALDKFHFDLKEGTKRWFICAFSAEDDFDHHSRMREHREVAL
jgi:hypothetical protein